MNEFPRKSQLLIYQAENGAIKIDVRFENETVWLTQQLMAELFQTTQQNVSLHLQNIYAEGELEPEATHKEFLSVRQKGARQVIRSLDYYNLDAIISVGYRVKSRVATQFRIWATRRLRKYMVKGFVLDDERLKNPDLPFDYFDELLRRIPMGMRDWIAKLDGFLRLNERGILTNAGKITHELATSHAEPRRARRRSETMVTGLKPSRHEGFRRAMAGGVPGYRRGAATQRYGRTPGGCSEWTSADASPDRHAKRTNLQEWPLASILNAPFSI